MKARLALALDVDSLKEARYFVNKLYPEIKLFKVGAQLFTACGPRAVELIRKKGGEVFLDLKFFDIPHTVANAVRMAARQRVQMLTLHILGGSEMLKAAVSAARAEAKKLRLRQPLLIGVTVLTSKDADSGDVLALAKIGIESGLDGVVCSAREAALLRKKIKQGFLIITPGIRPKGVNTNDQKRVVAAEEAVKSGSNILVVGRPILEAGDPLSVVKELRRSL